MLFGSADTSVPGSKSTVNIKGGNIKIKSSFAYNPTYFNLEVSGGNYKYTDTGLSIDEKKADITPYLKTNYGFNTPSATTGYARRQRGHV